MPLKLFKNLQFMKKILIIFSAAIIIFFALFGSKSLQFKPQTNQKQAETLIQVVKEENLVIDVVEKSSSSVVTIGIVTTKFRQMNLFDPFNFFNNDEEDVPSPSQKVEQDIGTGFIVSSDGLIVTNKHVVSEVGAKYQVFLKDDKNPYEVQKIYRDPQNDLAIIKINKNNLKPLALGDSSKLKVGQYVIAIGTALGEFRNTVTTGVISGLGRGIDAGSPFDQESERLDNVIQTDAAINPGNSGGPLLNSAGQVIGVNCAVASSGQNIGFALPINIVKESLDNFNETGKFSRPYLGVQYRMISRKMALLNDIPEGAYIVSVIKDSPADRGGLKEGDIITKIEDKKLTVDDKNSLSDVLAKKKVGEQIKIELIRDEKKITLTVIIGEASGE